MAVTISGSTPTFSVATGYAGGVITNGTSATLSGTAVGFTSIPSWVKRITVMVNNLSSSAANTRYYVQIGSGSYVTTGYTSQYSLGGTVQGVDTVGFVMGGNGGSSTYNHSGVITLTLLGSNTWVAAGNLAFINLSAQTMPSAGNSPALGGVLDRVQITTNTATTFTGGTVNIVYE
jgi:hypothetical protein